MPWLLDPPVKVFLHFLDRKRLGLMTIVDGVEKREVFVLARS
jgi:hypothetical protein